METFRMNPFPRYLMQHHGCENSLQVGQIVVAELSYDAGVQQYQLERTRVWPDADHHCVPQVSEGGLTMDLPWDTSTVTGTRERPPTLDQNVPGMEIPVDKVVHKHLEHMIEMK